MHSRLFFADTFLGVFIAILLVCEVETVIAMFSAILGGGPRGKHMVDDGVMLLFKLVW